MNQEQYQARLELGLGEIRENRLRLDACKVHHFPTVEIKMGAVTVCSNCGSYMPVLEAAQYVRGYMAAGKDPNEVMPGFMPEWKPK